MDFVNPVRYADHRFSFSFAHIGYVPLLYYVFEEPWYISKLLSIVQNGPVLFSIPSKIRAE